MNLRGPSSWKTAGLCILFFIALGVYYMLNAPNDEIKPWAPGSFYEPINDLEAPTPLAQRNSMLVIKRGQSLDQSLYECKTDWVYADKNKMLSVYNQIYLPVEFKDETTRDAYESKLSTHVDSSTGGSVDISQDEFHTMFTDGVNLNDWYVWKSIGNDCNMNIVSPYNDFKYTLDVETGNTNMSEYRNQDDGISIYISPSTNENIRVGFHQVLNWWCHLDSQQPVYSHDVLVGANLDSNAKFSSNNQEGTVLGKATSSTYMTFEKYNESSDTWEKVSPYQIYYN